MDIVNLYNKIRYKFTLVYKPPIRLNSFIEQSRATALAQTLHKHCDVDTHGIVLGDFNLPGIDWLANSFKSDGIHNVLYDCFSTLGLSQFVLEPTRLNFNGNDNILDIIMYNDNTGIKIDNYMPPFGSSDHCSIKFSIFVPNNSASHPVPSNASDHDHPITLTIYDWSSGDYVAINSILANIDWNELFSFHFDADPIWDCFKSIVWPIIAIHVPTKIVPHNMKYKVRWYPKHIRKLISRKEAIWRTLKRTHDPSLKIKYDKIANDCKLAILNHDKQREERILGSNNLGAFFKFVNKKLSSKSGIAPLLTPSGQTTTSDLDKAEILNEYFESAFTLDNGINPPFPPRVNPSHDGIYDVTINPTIIRTILRSLKSNSAAGPDCLPSIFFKQTASELAFPLSIIYRTFIDLHTLPTEWRHANITPKFKKGSPSDPANYRPIALTCCCCKVLESIISSELIQYLHDHQLINKHQHGFLKNHSTCTNLIESLHDWTLSISNHDSVVVGYVDFARAFDSVSHQKLLTKLTGYGIQGNLLFWIQAFLTNRTQAVKVGSTLSSSRSVISGIPQGSVLGPLLFNIFINDITDNFTHVTAKLFADDVKLYTSLSSTSPAAVTTFQHHLDLIHSWSTTWQIGISFTKCNILQIGTHSRQLNYSISNHTLLPVDQVKDLGVLVDSKLKFNHHILDCVTRARQRSSLIFRGFLSRDTSHLKRAFITYVRPLVEYVSPVWSPSYIHLINEIESVQRTFTKRLPGLDQLTYADRLHHLKLQSLEHRRLLSDLILCF